MKASPLSRRPLWICIGAASLLYLALAPGYHIGVFNDDGVYVVAAKSLLQGSYSQLNHPERPPLTLYPPGFPLVLAPLIPLTGMRGPFLKVIPIGLTLLSLILLWKLFEGWLSPKLRILLISLVAFNPLTAAFSGLMMSEPLFICVLLGLFIQLREIRDDRAEKKAWTLGLLLGALVLIRTSGVVAIPAVALGLALSRRWHTLARTLPVAIAFCGLFYLRNSLVAGASTVYQSGWGLMFQQLQKAAPGRILQHVQQILSTFFLQNLISPMTTPFSLSFLFAGLWAIGIAAMALWSVREFLQVRQDRAVVIAISAFCVFHLGVQIVWIGNEPRYGMPLIPFILFALLKGAERCITRFPKTRIGFAAAAGLLIASYISQNAQAVRGAWSSRDPYHPAQTYRWIAGSTAPDAFLLTSGPAVVYLYTNRFTTLEAPARDAEGFYFQLLVQGIDYVLLNPLYHCPTFITSQDPNRIWSQRKRWILADPQAYRPVYQNSAEAREIFQVRPDPTFQAAYVLYLSALSAFDRAAWSEGFELLDQALEKDPGLISAYNAYGVGSLLSGKRLGAALSILHRAHRLQPNHALILLNLARLERRLKDPAAARHFALALAEIERTGDYASLVPIIQREAGL
ncbi:MAG: hypothetical protein A2992_02070 [Elusimicrobia bacterium RIFCSPLOWO2_01_FULL_59_12]|nr:MAG: hypothetical protein A2992_02070 [Elusimicrobia bacterium RIFCSPLOWO2_01_FULL_59_12]